MEKQENLAGCCSGCAGDYEDADAGVWDEEMEEEQGDTEWDRGGRGGSSAQAEGNAPE